MRLGAKGLGVEGLGVEGLGKIRAWKIKKNGVWRSFQLRFFLLLPRVVGFWRA